MNWLSVLSALVKHVRVIVEMAGERKAKGADRAEVVATHALDLIRKARDARRAASNAVADPARVRDDDGFGRD